MRIHILKPKPPKPKQGDVRTTKKYGKQVRVMTRAYDMRGRVIGYNCTGGKQNYHWEPLNEATVKEYRLEYLNLLKESNQNGQ